MSKFLERFKELCSLARHEAMQSGEQAHVCSSMIDDERVLELVTMRDLPHWLESHMLSRPVIHYSSPHNLCTF